MFTGLPEAPHRGWWDVKTGFEGSHESVPARNEEERRALEPSVRRLELLGLLEDQHLEGARTAVDAERLASRVRTWAAEEGPSATVAVPAGAGWRPGLITRELVRRGFIPQPGPRPHPGHEYVRDAVLDALGADDAALVLYEELTYCWGGPADTEAKRVGAARGVRTELVSLPVDREAKAARIALYASQVPHISTARGPVDDPSVLPADERYWRLRKAPAVATRTPTGR